MTETPKNPSGGPNPGNAPSAGAQAPSTGATARTRSFNGSEGGPGGVSSAPADRMTSSAVSCSVVPSISA